MGINKFNAEGYYDPTPYEALKTVSDRKAFRPLVYICSPYAGDTATHTNAARRYSRFAIQQGCIPIAPHLLYPQFLDDTDPDEREIGLLCGTVLMHKCREVWVFGSIISPGMDTEIRKAKWKRMTVRYFTEDLKEVVK